MRRFGKPAAGLVVVAALAACKDPTTPAASLSLTQSVSMVQQLAAAAVGALVTAAPGAAGGTAAAHAEIPLSYKLQASVGCTQGGTISVAGTITGNVDGVTGTGALAVSASETLSQCIVTIEGTAYLLSGTLGLFGNYVIVGGVPAASQTASLGGNVSFRTASTVFATCALDLTITYQLQTAAFTVSGTACDRSINF